MKRWVLLGASGLMGASLLGATLAAHADTGQNGNGNQPTPQANAGQQHEDE